MKRPLHHLNIEPHKALKRPINATKRLAVSKLTTDQLVNKMKGLQLKSDTLETAHKEAMSTLEETARNEAGKL